MSMLANTLNANVVSNKTVYFHLKIWQEVSYYNY